MEDQSLFNNSQPSNGISEGLQNFINAMVEEIVLEGKPFDTQKKYLRKFSESEGLDYGKLEADITTFIEILDSLKTAFSKLQVKLAEEKGRDCHISEETVKKLVKYSSQPNAAQQPYLKLHDEQPRPIRSEKPAIKNGKNRKWPWVLAIGAAITIAVMFLLRTSPTSEASFTGSANGHEWVDLGLPSGTLWATCNVGANAPEEYGDYFAWGETKTKSTYNWETYKYANGDYKKLIKYCTNSEYGDNGFTDHLTILRSDDDPATVHWGSGWHAPSKEQYEELKDNTTHQWTTQNGVQGRLFTSSNGQSVFLPAAGYRLGNELNRAEAYGTYWSQSLGSEKPYHAWDLFFDQTDCRMYCNIGRSYGFTARPVRQK